ncbi:type I restriction enzyme R subunit [Spinactinospora alkalitolerans]|uniref:Type I restriction enzyme R subunit n=1 Tax=Spinactinospora alkalitolerans TaxID=687207 RepID=A0A852U8Y0_9ACTN|nr:type I restriction endonuclease [Spinactinospora alkalitolerans]NYE50390.1 type I restriction enzyme R subunit [Spinactinospora alkalitolerans]
MSSTVPAYFESRFENAIVADLARVGGWRVVEQDGGYDVERAVDTARLFEFLGKPSQRKRMDRLRAAYGGEADLQRGVLKRITDQLDKRGVLDVLRNGVKDQGVDLELAHFKPEGAEATDALAHYRENILSVTPQLRYSAHNGNSLDLAFFVNGLPVATAELKNPPTGQTVAHAMRQYREDRDPREKLFTKRALVHFAVDTDEVHMTTRLARRKTVFLPFNQGSNGPSKVGGKGNRKNVEKSEGSYPTAYLWREVLERDAFMEILQRFLSEEENGGTTLIFPRFHQWHAVREITKHAARHGSGENYLAQHSAGSGKSNTIAWLALRLVDLHTLSDRKKLEGRARGIGPDVPVFDKILVVTDRTVLNDQLSATVKNFVRTRGAFKAVTGDDGGKSAGLLDALQDSTTRIVTVTLQTFPYALKLMKELPGLRCAIIADEAHSSQSGTTSKKVRAALSDSGEDDADTAAEDDGVPEAADPLAERAYPNLSFFAFTATPKKKTLNLFGVKRDDGTMGPFHLYSMHQAVDEGFILDVLSRYITYDRSFQLVNKAVQDTTGPEDPEVDVKKAKAALMRMVDVSDVRIRELADLIVRHFHRYIAPQMGGRSKAMVVTGSRRHAVLLHRAIEKRRKELRWEDCRALVAFSGELRLDGQQLTESRVNGFSEQRLPAAFGYTRADDPHGTGGAKDEYRVLVVADKYQTGFDQPLLTTMYVDKKLGGVQAVQTLSRLNRTHPHKSQNDLFILDFRNTADEIAAAFQDYYSTTLADEVDPNLLYERHSELLASDVLDRDEIAEFDRLCLPGEDTPAHADMVRLTGPALERFGELIGHDGTAAEKFRGRLDGYQRGYGFLQLIAKWVSEDADLRGLYRFGGILLGRLPRRAEERGIDLSRTEVAEYRPVKSSEQRIRLSAEEPGTLGGFTVDERGPGGERTPETGRLSDVIAEINDMYGLGLRQEHIDGPIVDVAEQTPRLKKAAAKASPEDFKRLFIAPFRKRFLARVQADPEDAELFRAYNNRRDLRDLIDSEAARRAQKDWG